MEGLLRHGNTNQEEEEGVSGRMVGKAFIHQQALVLLLRGAGESHSLVHFATVGEDTDNAGKKSNDDFPRCESAK